MTLFNRLPIYPYGVKISMTWLQVAAHLDSIERFGIKLFVELGVLEGGLTSVLLPGVKAGLFDYIGVELKAEYVNKDIAQQAVILYGDCFATTIKDRIKKVIDYTDGPVLLFCDNGDKPREVKEYSPLLRAGDFLSVHDYGTEVMPDDLESLESGFEELDKQYRREVVKMPMFRKL